MKITLLTHAKELAKRSNTGRMVLKVLGGTAEQLCWDRLRPPASLLEDIAAGGVALVYPGADDAAVDLSGISQFVLIDSTWHGARRIHQRSPYLHTLPRVGLKPKQPSRYNLRKNQRESGLCTAECVIELLRSIGHHHTADQLELEFLANMRPAAALQLQRADGTVNSG